MILIAHTLPVEARIAQKAGVRLWFTLTFRILGASIFGILFGRIIFTLFVMIILIKIINLISKKNFEKYLMTN